MNEGSSPFFLSSARLGFRHWRVTDLEDAMRLWGDVRVTKLFDARGALSDRQVKERLDKEIDLQKAQGMQYWPVYLLKTRDFVGCCGLRPYDLSQRIYEIGFHICFRHWGTGYAFEAADAVIGYAFTALNANSLFAGHHPENHSSRHLLEKLGFQYTHDEFYPSTGLDHPSYLLMNYTHVVSDGD